MENQGKSEENQEIATITPAETITFKYYRNLLVDQREELSVSNETDNVVAFKLKGTSPKIIKMCPGYGYLKPRGKVTIWVVVKLDNKDTPPVKEHITILLALAQSQRPMEPYMFWHRPDTKPENPFRKKIKVMFVEQKSPLPKKKRYSKSWVEKIPKPQEASNSECGSTSSEDSKNRNKTQNDEKEKENE